MTDLKDAAKHETVLDRTSQRLARVYAEALQKAADKAGQSDRILDDLEALVREVFRAQPALEGFLGSLAVPQAEKDEAINKSLGGKLHPVLVDFLHVLNKHRRLDQLRAVYQTFRGLMDEQRQQVRVQVRSAAPLGEHQVNHLRERLRGEVNGEPVLELSTDPNLLGGLVVQIGDHLYDGSVRTQLDLIRNQLLASSSHAIQRGRDRLGS